MQLQVRKEVFHDLHRVRGRAHYTHRLQKKSSMEPKKEENSGKTHCERTITVTRQAARQKQVQQEARPGCQTLIQNREPGSNPPEPQPLASQLHPNQPNFFQERRAQSLFSALPTLTSLPIRFLLHFHDAVALAFPEAPHPPHLSPPCPPFGSPPARSPAKGGSSSEPQFPRRPRAVPP